MFILSIWRHEMHFNGLFFKLWQTILLNISFLLCLSSCLQSHPSHSYIDKDSSVTLSGTIYLPDFQSSPTVLSQQVNTSQSHTVPASQIISGEFIIRTKPNLSSQSIERLSINGTNLFRTGGIPKLGISFYKATQHKLSQLESRLLLNRIHTLDSVLNAEPNTIFKIDSTPNDQHYPLQWNLRDIQTPSAWKISTGKSTTVAVIDTGITQHPDLNKKILPGIDLITDIKSSGDGDGIDYDPTDHATRINYHGSHVSGIIAASSNNQQGISGVNWGAKILPVRVIGIQGHGTAIDIYKGVAWAAGYYIEGIKNNPNPARIINMSLSGKYRCSLEIQRLFNQLASEGIMTVVAAGNDNLDAHQFSPASCHNVITVGATNPTQQRSSYSNHGSRIDIMAPGGQNNQSITIDDQIWPGGILSTVYNNQTQQPDYQFMQGTSMAAPHVSGALAILIGLYPHLSYKQVIDHLKTSTQSLSCDIKNGCGSGLLSVAHLLKRAHSIPPKKTILPQDQIYITALYQDKNGIDHPSRNKTKLIHHPEKGMASFTLKKLSQGFYRIFSFVDLNQNQQYDNGEPYGHYPALVNAMHHRHLKRLDIQIQNFDRHPPSTPAINK